MLRKMLVPIYGIFINEGHFSIYVKENYRIEPAVKFASLYFLIEEDCYNQGSPNFP
jgi:hypothetical protein